MFKEFNQQRINEPEDLRCIDSKVYDVDLCFRYDRLVTSADEFYVDAMMWC
jgi:hypothetical protein